ncbi:MAG: hypothetical protein ACPG8W_24700 [Candidatus Promineifilaceae bacterium]
MNEIEDTNMTTEDEIQGMRHPFCGQNLVDEVEYDDDVDEIELPHYECFRF